MKSRRIVSLYALLVLAALIVFAAAEFNSAPQVAQAASPMFQHPFTYDSGGQGAQSVVVVDVNGDNIPDLVVANDNGNGHGTVGVLLGMGESRFQPAVAYDSGGAHAWSVAVADVNGDGKLDIIVMNAGPGLSVGVLLGHGDGTFSPVATINGPHGYTISVADVNGDGKPDLITGGCDVLLGNGDGTFQSPRNYGAGNYAAVGDVNGDGKLDIITIMNAGGVGILLGNGDGTFQAPVLYSTGAPQSNSIAVADVNGDGTLDIAVANYYCSDQDCTGDSSASVLLGNGDGTFKPATLYDSGGMFAQAIAIGDVTGDGIPDLIVGNDCGHKPKQPGCSQHGVVTVLAGSGNGTFQTLDSFLTPNAVGSIAIADVNGGRTDLMLASLSGSVMALYGEIVPITITVSSSANPSTVNQSVILTATIQPAFGQDQGGEVIGFYDGQTLIGFGSTTHGVATLTTSFSSKGRHRIKAAHSKDFAFGKRSVSMIQVVNP